MANDDNYNGVLLEDIQDKLARFAEAMVDVPSTLKSVEERLGRLEEDVTVIRAVVTDQSAQLADHEDRLHGDASAIARHERRLDEHTQRLRQLDEQAA